MVQVFKMIRWLVTLSLLFSFLITITVGGQVEKVKYSTRLAEGLSISGQVFHDLNGDCLWNQDEPGLPGWTVNLARVGLGMINTTSDASGRYNFTGLDPGIYTISLEVVEGWNDTAPGGGFYQVTMIDRNGYGYDFGEIVKGAILPFGPSDEYMPIMSITPEGASRIQGFSDSNPSAPIDLQIMGQISTVGQHFSLLNYLKYTPLERYQGMCGDCWAWAGTGVIEVDMAAKTAVKDRLSVQYINSNWMGGSSSTWACCGGWINDVATLYSNKKMVIPWTNTNAHFQDGSRICSDGSTAVPASSISTIPCYGLDSIQAQTITTTGVGTEIAISNIKNVLHQNKAISFSFFLPNSASWALFKDFWRDQPEEMVWDPDTSCGQNYDYNTGGGHCVLCVGYDDTDPSNRYWIMVNSWGTTYGRPAGIFRMSMDMNYDCSYTGFGRAFYWDTLEVSYTANSPPSKPSLPSGSISGKTGTVYTYCTTSTDPDSDLIKYTFDWGDGTTIDTEYLPSGSTASATHRWTTVGDYSVKVKAVDCRSASSDWSDPLLVDILLRQSGWTSYGGLLISGVSMIVDRQGRVHILAVGSDHALWDNVDGTWICLGGYLTTAPMALLDARDRIHILAGGYDGVLMDNVFDTANWNWQWTVIGGSILGRPSALVQSIYPDWLAITVIGSDHSLWLCDFNTEYLVGYWYSLGGYTDGLPNSIEQSDCWYQNINTFVRGGDNGLWANLAIYDDGLETWLSQWYPLGGMITSNARVVHNPNNPDLMHVFLRGTDGGIWINDFNAPLGTGAWRGINGFVLASGWGGVYQADIEPVVDSSGNVCAFAVGGDGNLWMNKLGNWVCLDGTISSDIESIYFPSADLFMLAVRGIAGDLCVSYI